MRYVCFILMLACTALIAGCETKYEGHKTMKVYHLPGCPKKHYPPLLPGDLIEYRKEVDVRFNSELVAYVNGYRPCEFCRPPEATTIQLVIMYGFFIIFCGAIVAAAVLMIKRPPRKSVTRGLLTGAAVLLMLVFMWWYSNMTRQETINFAVFGLVIGSTLSIIKWRRSRCKPTIEQ